MSALTNRRGITLVESIVAMVMIGMVAAAAYEVVGAQFRLAERSRRALEAEALASMRMDYMSLLTDPELLSLPDTVEKGKFDYPLDEYSWTTTSEPATSIAGVYDVKLTILWPNNSYTVNTYFYRRPQNRSVSQ